MSTSTPFTLEEISASVRQWNQVRSSPTTAEILLDTGNCLEIDQAAYTYWKNQAEQSQKPITFIHVYVGAVGSGQSQKLQFHLIDDVSDARGNITIDQIFTASYKKERTVLEETVNQGNDSPGTTNPTGLTTDTAIKRMNLWWSNKAICLTGEIFQIIKIPFTDLVHIFDSKAPDRASGSGLEAYQAVALFGICEKFEDSKTLYIPELILWAKPLIYGETAQDVALPVPPFKPGLRGDYGLLVHALPHS